MNRKLTPEDLDSLVDDLEGVAQANRDVLATEPRIEKPLAEALHAAKMRQTQLSEKPWKKTTP